MSAVSEPRVCVIGAGALRSRRRCTPAICGIETRVFGAPMRRWFEHMPLTNFLKSEGRASSLPDPSALLTLAAFCREQNPTYCDHVDPVSRDTFAKYGIAVQRRLVPHLENVRVTAVKPAAKWFDLTLATGRVAAAECTMMPKTHRKESIPSLERTRGLALSSLIERGGIDESG
jgi:hypothetical protein